MPEIHRRKKKKPKRVGIGANSTQQGDADGLFLSGVRFYFKVGDIESGVYMYIQHTYTHNTRGLGPHLVQPPSPSLKKKKKSRCLCSLDGVVGLGGMS
jgi:hypothetical protein